MFSRNSLANKKRKKLQLHSTNRSISGYLVSSAETNEANYSSENSVDSTEVSTNSNAAKKRLSNEFDDSFDLFIGKKSLENEICKDKRAIEMPAEKSPSKKSSKNNKNSPSKDACSPGGKNKSSRIITVKNCDYFDKASTVPVPCPFCFKFEYDIYSHISTECTPNSVSDATLSKLVEMHIKHWKQRRNLGVPDTIDKEDDIFKSSSRGNSAEQSKPSCSSGTTCYKIPVLKWTSKSKQNRHLLLRQTAAEREDKVTQKLAIVLMGKEKVEENQQLIQEPFKRADDAVKSQHLNNLCAKQLTFWNKSSLNPVEVTDDTYYIKSLAPFIAPVKKNIAIKEVSSLAEKEEDVDAEIADILTLGKMSAVKKEVLETNKTQSHVKEESLENDSCFSEHPSDFASNDHKDIESPKTSLSGNWRKIFNSSDLSDMTVLFSDGSFLGHSLVFYTHSIKIFRSISSSSDEESGKLLDWKDVSSVPARAYLRFIYCSDVRHFKSLDISYLETVGHLCTRYEDFTLLPYILNLIDSKKNYPNEIYQDSRNVTSPDIFEDMALGNSFTNTTYALPYKKESMDGSASSKRKLELTPVKSFDTGTNKKMRTDSCCDDDINDEANVEESKIDVVSISSEGTKSLSSAMTMSPGRYERLMARPLSQCSTLPPLGESPDMEDKLDSPVSPPHDSFSEKHSESAQNIESSPKMINLSPKNVNSLSNSPRHEDSFYYDNDTFDYNNYVNTSWIEELENGNSAANSNLETDRDKNIEKSKNSLDNYFDESIPSAVLEEICKTPICNSKSVGGSPVCQSTPTQSISPKNNLITPSAQIIVSDKVTPMLNYSNLISPELKGELQKYGLKPDMDRKKAKSLLSYIYDLIHPIVPKSEAVSVSTVDNRSDLRENEDGSKLNSMGIDEASNILGVKTTDTSSESILVCDDEDDEGKKPQYDFEPSEEITSSQDTSSYLTKNELLTRVSDFIKNDPVLFDSILKYVPIWLTKFHQALRENGIKCTSNDLMDVLDELCVTFRTMKKPKVKKKSMR